MSFHFRNAPKTILKNIENGSTWGALGQNVSDFKSYLDTQLNGPDDGKGAFNLASKNAENVKEVGKAIFFKVFSMTDSLAFAHNRSLPILQNTVEQLARVGLVHDVVEELGQDDAYNSRTLAAQIKSSKSASGNFFQMIDGVDFSANDQGMQTLLIGYIHALENVRDEGSTEPYHRPTAGLRIFTDILPDELQQRLHTIGPAHAQNSMARALFLADAVSGNQSDIPEELEASYRDNNGFVNDSNAKYHASILLAESVTAAPDFLNFAETDAERIQMAGRYFGVVDQVLDVVHREGWDDIANMIYPDEVDAQAVLRDDLNALLDHAPVEALGQNSDVVERLRTWSEGQTVDYGSSPDDKYGIT